MPQQPISANQQQALDEALGYIHLSAGVSDRRFLGNLNTLFAMLGETASSSSSTSGKERTRQLTHERLADLFRSRLEQLSADSEVFRDPRPTRRMIDLVHDHVLRSYREFHRDLLFHQDDETLFNAFFLGRVYETALQQKGEEGGEETAESRATELVARLCDYIGHRPVAVLETQKLEPYAHEWHRPVPLYIREVGEACGPYASLVRMAIEILQRTDPLLLQESQFDPLMLDELAMDARAYDFDHPVNKRPNYLFGQWDPHHIDQSGHYRRFVMRQMILDSLLRRVHESREGTAEELMFEAASALAGTILMAGELSGSGPGAHGSDETLGKLLPRIAAHRDRFYQWLINQDVPGRTRLIEEAQQRQQPFGAVRQHLNAELARCRATQLEQFYLARFYAQLGHDEAARRHAAAVPAARCRIVCQIQCLILRANLALDRGEAEEASIALAEITDLVHRGVECGAIVDPWNILGFDAHFSLFPALENSIHDHRIDELLELIDQVLSLHARTISLAAANDDEQVAETTAERLRSLADWWDRFATTTVSSVDGVAAAPVCDAAQAAAAALRAWHRGGTTTGDVGFWRPHVESFRSPKAFVLVIGALLDKEDFVASMGLLMHWLSEAPHVGLQEGSDSFHLMAGRWVRQLLDPPQQPTSAEESTSGSLLNFTERAALVTKFFDYLEANADEYWQVPRLELDALLGAAPPQIKEELEEDSEEDDADDEELEDDLYSAAYDGMVYRDSSDDGVDSELMGRPTAGPTDLELDRESKRIAERLDFLVTVARLARRTAQWLIASKEESSTETGTLSGWLGHLHRQRQALGQLLHAVCRHRVPPPGGSFDSLQEYDRRRWIKESLCERIISVCVTYDEAIHHLLAAEATFEPETVDALQRSIAAAYRAALSADAQAVRAVWDELRASLVDQPLLYVPLSKGGDCERIVAARSLQRTLRMFFGVLPRLGLLNETIELLRLAAAMERSQTVLPGSITEYDQLALIANQAIVTCLIQSLPEQADDADARLIDALEAVAQVLLVDWLGHSRTLRLSVLEKVMDEREWSPLSSLIRQYGHDMFVQQFLQIGNLRGILHRGIEAWIADVEEDASDFCRLKLVAAMLDGTAPPRAAELLQLALEAVAENYAEYCDYNSTTTQSDRGEMLDAFLDFLRLRVQYDRIDWNVAPVVQVHEILVRERRFSAAAQWGRELVERTEQVADQLLARLDALERRHGMRIPSVAARLRERFVRSLSIDRARALVRPAMDELASGGPGSAVAQLEQEIEELSREPAGGGLDVPLWLEALQDELEQSRWTDFRHGLCDTTKLELPQLRLEADELEMQLAAIRQASTGT